MLFPFIFPRYSAPKDELCEVIHICAGRRGGDDIEIEHSAFFVTIQDHTGARGKIDLGIIDYKSPWQKLHVGDKVVASVKTKALFPLEMKILKLKEIYHKNSETPVVLAA